MVHDSFGSQPSGCKLDSERTLHDSFTPSPVKERALRENPHHGVSMIHPAHHRQWKPGGHNFSRVSRKMHASRGLSL